MSTILVVEDDAAIRNNIARLLQLEGHQVSTARDGLEGLEQARQQRPEVVISDIGMPGLDGFALLEALRADPTLAQTAVLLLTALDDRASMRRGMTLGADDYLAKPFTRDELLEALAGLLRKRGRLEQGIAAALREREEQLRAAFADILEGGGELARLGLEPPAGLAPGPTLRGTVLFAGLREFTSLAEKLEATEVVQLLNAWFEPACERVLRHGGRHLRLLGAGLLAVFPEAASKDGSGARRALAAGLAVTVAGQQLRAWLERRFPGRGLPPFAVGVGLHAGDFTLHQPPDGDRREAAPAGPVVHAAVQLMLASRELGWSVTASGAVLAAAGPGLRTGAMSALQALPSRGYLDAAEVLGWEELADAGCDGLTTLPEPAREIAAAVQINSELTARAFKGALHGKLAALRAHRFAPGDVPPRLKGYRIRRKLGAGAMTEVYLAEREADGQPLVLKVLDAAGRGAGARLARFIQEYTLLARINDPHVVRIHDQGFTDDLAYIAMEYFPGGDLRAELQAGMTRQRALEVLAQLARALRAIHALGIIHRDLKPENVMRRPDGRVALADFGVAKSLLPADPPGLSRIAHGELVGTPYYLSPEQAAGQDLTPASDLYGLGVMLYEMLTGERPFRGDSLQQLLASHLSAAPPRLPAGLQDVQPVLDQLLAKHPAERHSSAQALLDDLQRRGLLAA